jgi:hypothetical protein
MFRTLLITLTALALILSSSGLSQIVHSCRMIEAAATATSCPMCTDGSLTDDPNLHGTSIEAPPCCSFVVQSWDNPTATSTTRFALPDQVAVSPLFVKSGALRPWLAASIVALAGPTAAVAERGRITYLRVSSFLI